MRYIKRTAVTAALLTLLMLSSLFAQKVLVDDHSDGTFLNELDAYWYYYDDLRGLLTDDRPQAAPNSTPSMIDVPYFEKHRNAFGNALDTFPVKDYQFQVFEEYCNRFAGMPFTFGEPWEASYGTALPFVGIGTMLAPAGKYISLAGATGVTFKIRSHKADLAVVFKVETYDIAMDSSETYYQKVIATTTTWTEVTVLFADLLQPTWTPPASMFIFDSSKVTNLSWEVFSAKNKNVTSDTLDLDDIYINNTTMSYNPYSDPRPSRGLFSDFEKDRDRSATPLGTCWYAYDDREMGGTSSISSGAEETGSGLLNLDWVEGSGANNTGMGAAIRTIFGPAIKQDNGDGTSFDVQGFAGIGFNMYDSATATYFDACTGKRGISGGEGYTNGIYFEFIADGDCRYLTLEIIDKNDVGDKNEPTRKDSRGSGIVWYRNLPTTGVWKAANVRFTDLIIHSDWSGYVNIPLDPSNLAKVQFKIRGTEGQGGILRVDNVYFPGIDFDAGVAANKETARSNRTCGFTASCCNGNIQVNWKQAGLTGGKVSLVNTKGTLVRSAAVTGGHGLTIPAGGLPAGMYFVNLSGSTANGKALPQHAVISIVR